MTRLLLFSLFVLMFAGDTLGINVGLMPGVSVKNAFLYLILISVAIEAALERNRKIELLPVIVPYSLYFLYAMFTWLFIVLLVQYPGYSAFRTLISLKGNLAEHVMVLLVFFYGIKTVNGAASMIRILTWAVVVGNIVTIIDTFDIPDLGIISEPYQGRIVGFIGEPNQYAAFLNLFLPSALLLALLGRGYLRVAATVGFAASVLALFMTVSRGGLVGIVSGSIIGAVLLRRYVSGKAVVSSALAIVVLSTLAISILYATGFGDVLFERTIESTTAGSAYQVSSGRTYLWSAALKKMLEEPTTLIFGYGWDSYRYFPDFRLAPHNTYLKVFFELGFIGLMLLLVTIINVLRVARNGIRYSEGIAKAHLFAFVFGFLGLLVAILFVDLSTPWILIWAYIGTCMRMAVLQIETGRSENPDAGIDPSPDMLPAATR